MHLCPKSCLFRVGLGNDQSINSKTLGLIDGFLPSSPGNYFTACVSQGFASGSRSRKEICPTALPLHTSHFSILAFVCGWEFLLFGQRGSEQPSGASLAPNSGALWHLLVWGPTVGRFFGNSRSKFGHPRQLKPTREAEGSDAQDREHTRSWEHPWVIICMDNIYLTLGSPAGKFHRWCACHLGCTPGRNVLGKLHALEPPRPPEKNVRRPGRNIVLTLASFQDTASKK